MPKCDVFNIPELSSKISDRCIKMPDEVVRGFSLPGSTHPTQLTMPQIPDLRKFFGNPDAKKLVDDCGTATFAEANPDRFEWQARKQLALLWENAKQLKAARMEALLQQTTHAKCVAAGPEPDAIESRLHKFGQTVLFFVVFLTITTAVNAAATYVLDAGAWSLLLDHPFLAFFFVIGSLTACVGGLLSIAFELRDDESKRRYRMMLAVLMMYTDTALHAWLLVTEVLTEPNHTLILKNINAINNLRDTPPRTQPSDIVSKFNNEGIPELTEGLAGASLQAHGDGIRQPQRPTEGSAQPVLWPRTFAARPDRVRPSGRGRPGGPRPTRRSPVRAESGAGDSGCPSATAKRLWLAGGGATKGNLACLKGKSPM